MRDVAVVATLVLMGVLVLAYSFYIRPVVLRRSLSRDAEIVARVIADEIDFLAASRTEGAIVGEESIKVSPSRGKLVEIYVLPEDRRVVVRVVSGSAEGRGEAAWASDIRVVAPSPLYSGEIIFSLRYDQQAEDYVLYISNLKAEQGEGLIAIIPAGPS